MSSHLGGQLLLQEKQAGFSSAVLWVLYDSSQFMFTTKTQFLECYSFLFTKNKCRKTVKEQKLTTSWQAAAMDQSDYLDPCLQQEPLTLRMYIR